jgi:HSP20 family protein
MSLTHFFYEPFYSLSDFDRLFDDAFTRQNSESQRGQVAPRGNQLSLSGLRPRYVFPTLTYSYASADFE